MTEIWLNQRYQLLQPLGQGGFAQTYLAADHGQSKSPCVIKQLLPANPSPQFLATARRFFQAEVEVLRRLGQHPCIPELLDAFEVDGEFYLVQEFIDGDAVSDLFQQKSRLSEAEIIHLLQEVLPILAFIHQAQVIHRDIKPSNLMRRRADGQYMLIDFGAVKEITTDVYTAGSEQFTVSIGTQGYAAPEQMAGRPRYSSDLYGLGMTVIRGLTGRSPTELPENPETGDVEWESAAPDVSPGLQIFLQRLTKASIYQRYPSAAAALADLARYDQLEPAASTELPETTINPLEQAPQRQEPPWRSAIAALLVTTVVLTIRQVGGWVPLEVWIRDRWMQAQPPRSLDERLLVVEVTEADLMALQQTTPSDAVLSQVIDTLQAHGPEVIGLDLYRDIPQGAGQGALRESLSAANVVAIRQLASGAPDNIPAPQGVPPERVGFNDFPVDADGVVRRNLLMASGDESPEAAVLYSFALRLALVYLQARDTVPLASAENADYMALNGTPFVPLDAHFGGYRGIDAAGYQVMLQYRGAADTIPSVSLSEVLEGRLQGYQVRDRIVLIGTTAASAKDFFLTPYSAAAEQDFLMAGVMLHAQATSQILSVALDGQPLPWALPEAVEVVWIVLGATGGTWLAMRVKRLWILVCGFVGGGVMLIGLPVGILIAGGWMPMVPALVAFVGSAIAAALLRNAAVAPPPRLEPTQFPRVK